MILSGIYQIRSQIKPNRIYIGSAVDIKKRFRDHLRELKKQTHHSRKLQNHYNKYGESDLQFSILLGCERENLIIHEQFFIDALNPFFNIAKIAGSCLGLKQSDEVKNKHRLASLGNKHKLGKHHSEETRQKISIANKGNKNALGRFISLETRNKIGDSHRGKKLSDEHRKKLSDAHMGHIGHSIGKHHSDETKRKISLAKIGSRSWNKGKVGVYSKETLKKMSESHKGKFWNKKNKNDLVNNSIGIDSNSL